MPFKKKSIKDLGSLHYYLGIEILRNTHGLVLSQRKYALELLKCGNVLNDKPVTIPIDPLATLNLTDGELLQDPSRYRTLVGKLIYLTITRPDISFAAQLLSKFSQAPRTPHMKALLKVLRYIKLCPGQGLHFPTTNNQKLSVYCDSDWARYQQQEDLPLVSVFFEVPFLFHGNQRRKLLSQDLPQKVSIEL